MGDYIRQGVGVNTADLRIVIPHALAEPGNIIAEVCKALVSAEQLVKDAAVRKICRQLRECTGRRSGGSNNIRLHILDRLGIIAQTVPKGDDIISKVGNVVISGKEADKASAVRNGFGKLHESLTGNGGICDSLHIQASNRKGVSLNRGSERN